MTKEVIGKLEEAFAYDATIAEACFYAGINPDTYYTYAKEHQKFSERVDALRQQPIMKARQTIVDGLEDPLNAKWYLERKAKSEFAVKAEVEHTGGLNPIKVLLEKYGINEGDKNDRQTDEPVQSPFKGTT